MYTNVRSWVIRTGVLVGGGQGGSRETVTSNRKVHRRWPELGEQGSTEDRVTRTKTISEGVS